MASLLSDDELRRRLKLFGVEVGPVTSTTRALFQKKLNSLQNKNTRTLNALSSDDSEVDQNDKGSNTSKNHRKKRYNHRTSPAPIPQLDKLNVSEKKSSPNDVFRKPFMTPSPPVPPRFSSRLASSSSSLLNKDTRSGSKISRKSFLTQKERSSFDVETSDSDFDAGSAHSTSRTHKRHNYSSQNHYAEEDNDDYLSVFKRSSKSFSASTPNGGDLARRDVQKQTDWLKNLRARAPNSVFSDIKHSKDYNNANGYISDILNGEFQNSNKVTGKTTNYSYCVSWMIVLVTAAFFVVIGAFYMSAVQKSQMATTRSQFHSDICENKNVTGCIPQEYLKCVLAASHELHKLLSAVAGEYECHSGRSSRSLSLIETRSTLEKQLGTYDADKTLPYSKIFHYTILLSLRRHDWGIRIISATEEKLTALSDQAFDKFVENEGSVSALESQHASKSLWCRFRHSAQWTLTRIMITAFVVVALCLSFMFIKLLRKRKEVEEKEFYDLVERIIDILQQPDDIDSPSSSSKIPSKAVVHLRDSLIPLKQRRTKQKLWDKAVAFIEENESRVQVDFERIGGEEFKIWRWLRNPVAESEGGKHGKVWQGQAFGNQGKGKNHVPYSPTPCLKIRNMFDPEVEYGDDWQVSIQDAILDKCEGNDGILHVAMDTSAEGCIYMLCDSRNSAGKAYNALHGWWFDGKLVTVKYLRLERYFDRYPSAENCVEPLKPSNNKRLSLSAPFFSSALERS